MSLPLEATLLTDGFDDGTRDDSVDGINWYSINGTTSGGAPKPGLEVLDDSAGIGSGNALFIESRGSGSEYVGIFGQTVSLGSNIGDKVVLQFDLRIDGTNNGDSLRFGIYEDSDSQLGTSGWGTSDGDFDGANPGARNDVGFQNRLPLVSGGDNARINDELVTGNILSSGTDFVAKPDAGTFPAINDNLKHTITFKQERTGLGANDLFMTLDIDGSSFGDDDGTDTISSVTNFDYFVAVARTDTDWVIDNFSISAISAVPEPAAGTAFAFITMMLLVRRRQRLC